MCELFEEKEIGKILPRRIKRVGGIPAKRKTSNDVYFDEAVAGWLWDFIFEHDLYPIDPYDYKILDACAGNGVLGKKLMDKLGNMFSDYELDGSAECDYVDIDSNDLWVDSCDILEWDAGYKYDIIICNPPWSPCIYAERIYRYLLTLLKPDGWLYFIINYSFINSNWKRGEKLGNGLTIFLPRYTFHKAGCPLLDPVLMINRQNKDDPPFFCLIPPEIAKRYNKDQIEIKDKI